VTNGREEPEVSPKDLNQGAGGERAPRANGSDRGSQSARAHPQNTRFLANKNDVFRLSTAEIPISDRVIRFPAIYS